MRFLRGRACLATVMCIACTASRRAPSAVTAEFLLVSDDSSAWVRVSADTVTVLRAPIMLAVLAGRLTEVSVVEEAHDFENASFLISRVFRRDLVTGDSAMVFTDSMVVQELQHFTRANPDAVPLSSDEEPGDGARSVESSVVLLDVVGHTLGVEVHRDRMVGEIGTHDTFRATLDLRTGKRLRVTDILTPGAASSTLAAAEQSLGAAVALAARRDGTVGRAVSRAIAALPFDPVSFSLKRKGDALSAEFLAHDEQVIDEARDSHRYTLEPIVLPSPLWWSAVRATLPREVSDTLSLVTAGGLTLELAYDAYDMAVVHSRGSAGSRALLRLRGPVRRVIALSDSLVVPGGAWRGPLTRAFSQSAYYSDEVRAASLRRRARPTATRQAAL
jgi:hypothetical protein